VVYESAPQLAEVGAGVQLGPNAVRIWFDWGLGPDLLEVALNLQELFIHNWKDGRTLGHYQIAGAWDRNSMRLASLFIELSFTPFCIGMH
jgi:2-polyprenyl-6-methoxyphenol hydroxylase-like FAD-dependent oxidoreductase